MRNKLIAGNWKMYKTTAEAVAFVKEFKVLLPPTDAGDAGFEVVVCAPFTLLTVLASELKGSSIRLGAQNMYFEEEGAFTGEISAAMLKELGVDYCIIGHSERRQFFGETDGTVNKKLHMALKYGVTPIFCLGEVLTERDAGLEFDVVKRQVAEGLVGISASDANKIVVAYEPVWAIGTGRTATDEQAQEMCAFIRKQIEGVYSLKTAEAIRIQYGGSVKPENAAGLLGMPDIDGALVGGASLFPDKFFAICRDARNCGLRE